MNHAPPSFPHSLSSSEALNAAIARTAPAVLALLADGVPRPQKAILATLADRHARDEVRHALLRLAVTGRLVERDGRFTLPSADAPAVG